jgi:hypothetical protein
MARTISVGVLVSQARWVSRLVRRMVEPRLWLLLWLCSNRDTAMARVVQGDDDPIAIPTEKPLPARGRARSENPIFIASLAAFCFGAAVVVRRRRSLPVWAPWAAIAVFASFAFWLTFHSAGFERIRPLIVEAILRASDDKQAWHTADRVLFLVRFNTWVALVAVGTLLAALYAASVRAVDREPDLDDLLRRREIAHWVLGFGSTLLVIAVFASEILVDWPASLLAKPQQAALKPLGEALTLLLGAVGTIALFAAMAPALAAYVLDVRRYRARTTVWFVEPEPRPAAQPSLPAKKPAQLPMTHWDSRRCR